MPETQQKSLYFPSTHPKNRNKFCRALQNKLTRIASDRPLIFLCIGSDRATGDSLGPLVGQRLAAGLAYSKYNGKINVKQESSRNIFYRTGRTPYCNKKAVVYGTLRQTVHAGNLTNTLADIHNRYDNPYIIAIDASLGVPEHIGYVTLGNGSLRPGIGVSHDLPEAGDMHITGIVNHSTQNNHFTLQTTKLLTVMELAVFIADGILEALHVSSALQSPQKSHFINIL